MDWIYGLARWVFFPDEAENQEKFQKFSLLHELITETKNEMVVYTDESNIKEIELLFEFGCHFGVLIHFVVPWDQEASIKERILRKHPGRQISVITGGTQGIDLTLVLDHIASLCKVAKIHLALREPRELHYLYSRSRCEKEWSDSYFLMLVNDYSTRTELNVEDFMKFHRQFKTVYACERLNDERFVDSLIKERKDQLEMKNMAMFSKFDYIRLDKSGSNQAFVNVKAF